MKTKENNNNGEKIEIGVLREREETASSSWKEGGRDRGTSECQEEGGGPCETSGVSSASGGGGAEGQGEES